MTSAVSRKRGPMWDLVPFWASQQQQQNPFGSPALVSLGRLPRTWTGGFWGEGTQEVGIERWREAEVCVWWFVLVSVFCTHRLSLPLGMENHTLLDSKLLTGNRVEMSGGAVRSEAVLRACASLGICQALIPENAPQPQQTSLGACLWQAHLQARLGEAGGAPPHARGCE